MLRIRDRPNCKADALVRSCFLSLSCRASRQHKTEIPDDRELAYVHCSLRSAVDSHVSGTGVPRSRLQVLQNAIRKRMRTVERPHRGRAPRPRCGITERTRRKGTADGYARLVHSFLSFDLDQNRRTY